MTRIFYVMIAFLSLSLFVYPAALADVPTADDEVAPLVGKIIIASGRKAAVVGMSGVHASGDREAYMRRDRAGMTFFQRPVKLRVDTGYQRSSETRVLTAAEVTGERIRPCFPPCRTTDSSPRYVSTSIFILPMASWPAGIRYAGRHTAATRRRGIPFSCPDLFPCRHTDAACRPPVPVPWKNPF